MSDLYLAYSNTIAEGSHTQRYVLDGDTDLDALKTRVNAYMASPKMVNYNRGQVQQIPTLETESPRYHGSGGGCHYVTWLSIVELPQLQVEPAQQKTTQP